MGSSQGGDGQPSRILIVDDEQVLLDLLRDALRFAGYEVTTAADGFAAVSAAGKTKPDSLSM